jgi:hypothetical protein
MKGYQHTVLQSYVSRAVKSGTLQDASIAIAYLSKVTGKGYEVCAAALRSKYGIRHAPAVCATKGMWCPKDLTVHVPFDKQKAVWVRADVPSAAIANI